VNSVRSLSFAKGIAAVAAVGTVFLAGCSVGPRYARPSAPDAPQFKELPPNWKAAQPNDQLAKGKWWEVFQDPQLNQLEEQINVSNQSLKAAQAQFEQARALVRVNRASYYPTITAGVAGSRNRVSTARANGQFTASNPYTDLTIPVDLSYEIDVWGRVRHTVQAARANAQATAGDLESVSLSLHAELAADYFQVRTFDADAKLLDSTVASYTRALELTQSRYGGGVASQVDVAQAQTQLETTRAQAIDVRVARAQFEHAIAVLIGQAPAKFSLPSMPLTATPPMVPTGLPSDLLERRPDISAEERRMAVANEQIGIATAAYYPTISLSATGGFEGNSISNWFVGPGGFVSAGASAVETIFDAGRRRAVTDQTKFAYDQSVANYRQTVLTAFQEVEDNLAALRLLEDESRTQQGAVEAAERSLALSNNRYKGGVANYLEVTTAQTFALADERTLVQIAGRRMTASVQLIKALGGGWDTSSLPVVQNTKPSSTATGQ
jgi:NodT family efflux transporter outer membrane factor (OMF) lipoprotein